MFVNDIFKQNLNERHEPRFLDDDFYAYDPETMEIKDTWSHKSVGRRHSEYRAQQQGLKVVRGMQAERLGLHYPNKGVAEGSEDDIEDTRQFRNAVALAKSQKAIRQAKDGKNAKHYADGTKVTPDEVARRAAERKAKKQGVAEAIPYALSAANAAAEYQRQGQAGGGYRGRIDIPVQSREDYLAVGQALTKAARAAGQKIDYGLSDGVMSVFSDSMTADELDQFIDDVLNQGLAEGDLTDILNVPGKVLRTARDVARGMPTGTSPDSQDGTAAGDLVNTATKIGKQVIDTATDTARGMPTGTSPKPDKYKEVKEQGVAEGSVQDKLYKRHQELRKKRGAPDPEYYQELKATFDLPDDERRAQTAALKKKYKITNEDRDRYVEELGRAGYEIVTESATLCPECGGAAYADQMLAEKQDACYHKVKSRYKVWPSAYASGALVRCRKKGAANWGNKSKK